jgi:hypothetical protein
LTLIITLSSIPPSNFFSARLPAQHTTQQPALLAALQALAEGSKTQALKDTVQTQGPKQTIDKAAQSEPTQLETC